MSNPTFKYSTELVLYIQTKKSGYKVKNTCGNYECSHLKANTCSKTFKSFSNHSIFFLLYRNEDDVKGLKLLWIGAQCNFWHLRGVSSLSPMNSPLPFCSLSSLPDFHRFSFSLLGCLSFKIFVRHGGHNINCPCIYRKVFFCVKLYLCSYLTTFCFLPITISDLVLEFWIASGKQKAQDLFAVYHKKVNHTQFLEENK